MSNQIDSDLIALKQEVEKLVCELPTFINKELLKQIKSIQSKSLLFKRQSNSIIRRTMTRTQNLNGLNTIFFWIEKTLNNLNHISETDAKIMSLSLQKDLLASTLCLDENTQLTGIKIKNAISRLESRSNRMEKMRDEKSYSLVEKKTNIESLSIAFENQIASLSLIDIMKNDESRATVFKCLTKLSEIFPSKKKKSKTKNKKIGKNKKKLKTKETTTSTDFPTLDKPNTSKSVQSVKTGENKKKTQKIEPLTSRTGLPQKLDKKVIGTNVTEPEFLINQQDNQLQSQHDEVKIHSIDNINFQFNLPGPIRKTNTLQQKTVKIADDNVDNKPEAAGLISHLSAKQKKKKKKKKKGSRA